MTDHYATLGVAADASQDDIKKAYRKLAMELHPDRNPGNASAEARFKEVSAAYAELGDPESRARYDQQRRFGGTQHGFHSSQGGFNFNFGFGGNDINDIINQFFAQQGFNQARQARNRDFTYNLDINLEEAFTGKVMPVQFVANSQNYNISVTIPAGVESGTRIRYAGHGDRSIPNVPPGDLYVIVHVRPHSRFTRNGPHLHTQIEINSLQAMLGCQMEIPCIDGQTISINIPEGTQADATLRLKERGMPVRASGSPRGDCLVSIKVVTPRNLSDDIKQALRDVQTKLGT